METIFFSAYNNGTVSVVTSKVWLFADDIVLPFFFETDGDCHKQDDIDHN